MKASRSNKLEMNPRLPSPKHKTRGKYRPPSPHRRHSSSPKKHVLEYIISEPKAKSAENSTQTLFKKDKEMQPTIITPKYKLKRKKIKLMNWKRYHRLGIIYSFLNDLERDFPAICTVSVIGKSVEGRDIKMLRISNSNSTNEQVWLDASIHPREWISTAVVTYIADQIVRNFENLPEWVTNKDWHIVPVLNPDGYEYTHTQNRMWRKNRAVYDGAQVGVDLNRNFSYAWGMNNFEKGTSDEPEHAFYQGPAPFSEPEAVAVRDTIMNAPRPFKVFLSFHSYFELIIFPWGHKTDPCPNYIHLLEAGSKMARVTLRYI